MKFLAILHAPFEGPGLIKDWIALQDGDLVEKFAWELPPPESMDDFDGIIVMGGPMSVNAEEQYPWLKTEKEYIKKAIGAEKKVLGICLGSQLLAHCLGARVYKNPEPEIGWFPLRKKFFMHSWFPVFDDNEKEFVFHWHGETFDLPEASIPLFESEGCKNQAFVFEDRILGLQFHPEITPEMITEFVEKNRNDLRPARYIQPEARMITNYKLYGETSKSLLYDLLDGFFIA